MTDSIHDSDSCENIKYDIFADTGIADTEIDRNILYTIKTNDNLYLNVIKNTDGSISSKYIEESKDKKIPLLDRKTKYVNGEFISSSTPYFYFNFDDKKLVFFLSDKENLSNKREINIHKYYNKLDPFFKDKGLELKKSTPLTDYKNIINTQVETEIVLIDNDNIKREGNGFKFDGVNKNIKGFNRSTTYTFKPVTTKTEVIQHVLATYKAEQTRVQSIHD